MGLLWGKSLGNPTKIPLIASLSSFCSPTMVHWVAPIAAGHPPRTSSLCPWFCAPVHSSSPPFSRNSRTRCSFHRLCDNTLAISPFWLPSLPWPSSTTHSACPHRNWRCPTSWSPRWAHAAGSYRRLARRILGGRRSSRYSQHCWAPYLSLWINKLRPWLSIARRTS